MYAGYRFPAEVTWCDGIRFPLNFQMVKEMVSTQGIEVSHETVLLNKPDMRRSVIKSEARRGSKTSLEMIGRFGYVVPQKSCHT